MTVRSLGDHIATINSLHAYVDGELTSEERRRVEALLQNRPPTAARVEDYLRQNQAIRSHHDPRAEDPLPPAIEAEVSQLAALLEGRSFRARIRSMVAPALMAASLAGLVWLGSDLSLRDRLAPAAPGGQQRAEAVEEPSASAAFPAPDLGRFGFQLVANRAIGSGPVDHRHLIYRDQAGAQLSLYLSDGGEGGELRNALLHQGPFSYLFWNHGSRQFGMIGEVDQDLLLAMGQAIDGNGIPAALGAEPAGKASGGAAPLATGSQPGTGEAAPSLPAEPASAQPDANPAEPPADSKPKDAAATLPRRWGTA